MAGERAAAPGGREKDPNDPAVEVILLYPTAAASTSDDIGHCSGIRNHPDSLNNLNNNSVGSITQMRGFSTTANSPTYGHLSSLPTSSVMTSGYLFRRTSLILLLLAVNYLLLSEWHPPAVRPAIRGGLGMRPVGEACHTDANGRLRRIHHRHAIVFDAGSTGSRVHVYELQYCGDQVRSLVDEVFEEVKPGLGHYHREPRRAAQSLQPLLKTALERVPKELQRCTPLVVRATAGLRLLPEEAVRSILEHVRTHLTRHPFQLAADKSGNDDRGAAEGARRAEKGAVTVMDGAEEAVFAWLTVNFLQDRLHMIRGVDGVPSGSAAAAVGFLAEDTSVVMDLGGASTQIVFAIPKAGSSAGEVDPLRYPQYYYRLRLQDASIDLYQQSYLGYGLMEARRRIKLTHAQHMLSPSAAGTLAEQHHALRFGCFPRGHQESIQLNETQQVMLTGDAAGWDACLGIVRAIFAREAPCPLHPCSFNGIHQPALRSRSLVAFSYFFDRLIPLGLSSPVTLFDVDREGRHLCQAATASVGGTRYEKLLAENPQWCLDLAYIYTLLRVGYQIDIDQPIVVTKQINGYEAGWSLGAALKLLEGTPPCDTVS